jgi:hypothetical protein
MASSHDSVTTIIGYAADTVSANAKYAGPGTARAPTGTQKGYDAQLPEKLNYYNIYSQQKKRMPVYLCPS